MSILLPNHRLPFINRIVYRYHIANFSSSHIFAVWVRNGRVYNEISVQVICRWFTCLHLGSQYTCTYLPPFWYWVHLHLPPSILVLSTSALTSLHLGSEYTLHIVCERWFVFFMRLVYHHRLSVRVPVITGRNAWRTRIQLHLPKGGPKAILR